MNHCTADSSDIPDAPRSGRTPVILRLAEVCALALIVLDGLAARLAIITKPFWGDEVRQNYEILRATGLWDLRTRVDWQWQPLLEHILRKYFWFPLFGFQELQQRLPSLAYSLGTIVTVYLLARWYFSHIGAGSAKIDGDVLTHAVRGVVPSLIVAWWVATHPLEIYYGVEARPYSFISWISALTFVAFAFRMGTNGHRLAIACVALNSHFFMILPVGLWGVCTAALLRGRQLVRFACGFASITAASLLFNWPSLSFLVRETHEVYPPAELGSSTLSEAFTLWERFFSYFQLPAAMWCLAAVAIVLSRSPAGAVRRHAVLFGAAFSLLLMPVFLFVLSGYTGHPYQDRHFFPFMGLGVVVMLLALDTALELFSMWAYQCLRVSPQRWIPLIVMCAWLIATVDQRSALLGRQPGTFFLPHENFTAQAESFLRLKALGRLLFVLDNGKDGWHYPAFYLHFIGEKRYRPMAVERAASPRWTPPNIGRRIQTFLESFPNGVIVLVFPEDSCDAAPTGPLPEGVNAARWDSCIWTVEGLRTLDQLKTVTDSFGFAVLPQVLKGK